MDPSWSVEFLVDLPPTALICSNRRTVVYVPTIARRSDKNLCEGSGRTVPGVRKACPITDAWTFTCAANIQGCGGGFRTSNPASLTVQRFPNPNVKYNHGLHQLMNTGVCVCVCACARACVCRHFKHVSETPAPL